MRGNLVAQIPFEQRKGSIPAYAGEPDAQWGSHGCPTVYPRVCGGTSRAIPQIARQLGLSPRMRGNRGQCHRRIRRPRSIPAYAGEPAGCACARAAPGVYPRVCGGTVPTLYLAPLPKGLSPRMRGNPFCPLCNTGAIGSIPAYAGEPCPCRPVWFAARVYPRVCGGTLATVLLKNAIRGLSPRMRGNRDCGLSKSGDAGSIPAYAGEPGRSRGTRRRSRVYPRVCGGTGHSGLRAYPLAGLSPRMRGNRDVGHISGVLGRSIPAYAGEPGGNRVIHTAHRVYPRVCGGTATAGDDRYCPDGLSPRMRGNPSRAMATNPCARSIPAYAGEPIARQK